MQSIVYVHRCTGYIEFGQSDEQKLNDTIESLRVNGTPHEEFTGHEANKRYPQQLKIPPTHKCFYDSMGGLLYASRALLAFQVNSMLIYRTISN